MKFTQYIHLVYNMFKRKRMRFFILKYRMKGIKNLDKFIELNYSKDTVKNLYPKDITKVKAMYGYNASGKSSIILSLALYKRIILNEEGLNNHELIKDLNRFINKKINEAHFEVIFTCVEKEEKIKEIYKHSLVIKLNKDTHLPYIASEKYEKLKGRTLNESYVTLINKEYEDESHFNSILSNYLKLDKNKKYKISEINDNYLYLHLAFIMNLNVVSESNIEITEPKFSYIYNKLNKKHLLKIKTNKYNFNFNGINDVINNKDLDKYKEETRNLFKFLYVFNIDLKDFKVDIKDIDESTKLCNLILVYEDYEIKLNEESNAMKKLSRLFRYFELYVNGEILFIDELDSSINPVYLNKLLEFFIYNDKSVGELTFTTHNFESLNVLKKYPHSLSFLTINKEVVDWIKNGNYNPYTLYKIGYIDGAPFNVSDVDYLDGLGASVNW